LITKLKQIFLIDLAEAMAAGESDLIHCK